MAEPFLAEIRMFSFNFPPKGWALCNGQVLPINQNQALFALLGTTYGGNGMTTFALPDLRGRTPLHAGGVHPLGQRSGAESHTLSINEMPGHLHATRASSLAADSSDPQNRVPAAGLTLNYRRQGGITGTRMAGSAVASSGGGSAHDNMQPSLVINFCIALQGIFPSHN